MHIIQFFTRRQWAGLGLLLAVIFAVYFNTWSSLEPRWNTRGEAYSHAYVLLLIAFGLAIHHRNEFLTAPARQGWLAIPLLLGASVVWLAGNLTQIGILQQVTLPAIPFLVIWACTGFVAARKLLFPFAILYTVIPFWDFIVPHLQDITVLVTSRLLATFGIPAFISEHYIQLPAGTLQVAEGCAGLSYLLISITLAMIYAYQARLPWQRASVLLGLGALLGLATNWLRVFGIAVIAFYSEMKSGVVKDHELFGWSVFAGCLVPFFLGARALEPTDTTLGANALPVSMSTHSPSSTPYSLRQMLLSSALAALFGPIIAYLFTSLPAKEITLDLPDRLNGATAQSDEISDQSWSPDFRGADRALQKTYLIDGHAVTMHLLTYLSQSQGKELINWGNRLANTDQWLITGHNIKNNLEETSITNHANSLSYRIYSWYDIGGYVTTSELHAKLLELPAALHQRKDASLIAIAFRCASSICPEKEAQAEWVKAIQRNAPLSLIVESP